MPDDDFEERLRTVEMAIVEITTMARMMKGILVILGLTLGYDISGVV